MPIEMRYLVSIVAAFAAGTFMMLSATSVSSWANVCTSLFLQRQQRPGAELAWTQGQTTQANSKSRSNRLQRNPLENQTRQFSEVL
jgi:hypothetical protein